MHEAPPLGDEGPAHLDVLGRCDHMTSRVVVGRRENGRGDVGAVGHGDGRAWGEVCARVARGVRARCSAKMVGEKECMCAQTQESASVWYAV